MTRTTRPATFPRSRWGRAEGPAGILTLGTGRSGGAYGAAGGLGEAAGAGGRGALGAMTRPHWLAWRPLVPPPRRLRSAEPGRYRPWPVRLHFESYPAAGRSVSTTEGGPRPPVRIGPYRIAGRSDAPDCWAGRTGRKICRPARPGAPGHAGAGAGAAQSGALVELRPDLPGEEARRWAPWAGLSWAGFS